MTHAINQIHELEEKLKKLNVIYDRLQKEYDKIFNDMDNQYLCPNYLNQATMDITIILGEMEIIGDRIYEIEKTIKELKMQLSN